MKVALVHDWLTGMRGGERCLLAFLKIYPDADIFTLLHVPGSTDPAIDERVRAASFLNKLPGVRRYYRLLLPLYPLAARSLDVTGYDLIISLSHAAAKNIRIPEGATHLCYCFTPMRYIWDQAENYFGRMTPLLWPIIRLLRRWDVKRSASVDGFAAISRFVAARVRCFYRRTANIIFPPVVTSWITPRAEGAKGEAFLYAGALVPYKNPELVVRVFNELKEPLWIVGTGPEEEKLKRIAADNIVFLGHVPDEQLGDLYRRCRALIFPGCEDFGLVPLECMAAGRPVIALHAGALRETHRGIKPWELDSGDSAAGAKATGVFIRNVRGKLHEELLSSISFFLRHEDEFRASVCVEQARCFSEEVFALAWLTFVNEYRSTSASTTKNAA